MTASKKALFLGRFSFIQNLKGGKRLKYTVNKPLVKKCIKLVTDSSRLGIVKSNYNGSFGTVLNIAELNYLYDHFHNTARDLTPELFYALNGSITIEKSKEFWGEYWELLFDNGSLWELDLDSLRDDKKLYDHS